MDPAAHYTNLIKQAKEAEKENDIDIATTLYEKAIKQKPVLELPYARLMVIYRKEKQYQKEMNTIKKALDVFTEVYDKKKQVTNTAKVTQISKALLKSLGVKSSDENFYPEPIAKWLKRKAVVEKKLKA